MLYMYALFFGGAGGGGGFMANDMEFLYYRSDGQLFKKAVLHGIC